MSQPYGFSIYGHSRQDHSGLARFWEKLLENADTSQEVVFQMQANDRCQISSPKTFLPPIQVGIRVSKHQYLHL